MGFLSQMKIILFFQKEFKKNMTSTVSVADPHPGSESFDPWIPNYSFESVMTIFWVKSYRFLCKLAQIFFLHRSKIKKSFNFVIFVDTQKIGQLIFFSGIWDG
jgi:hypothetical protein